MVDRYVDIRRELDKPYKPWVIWIKSRGGGVNYYFRHINSASVRRVLRIMNGLAEREAHNG